MRRAGQIVRILPSLQSTAAAIARNRCAGLFRRARSGAGLRAAGIVGEPMLLIEGGRHPVVERAGREPFIPNDVRFDN